MIAWIVCILGIALTVYGYYLRNNPVEDLPLLLYPSYNLLRNYTWLFILVAIGGAFFAWLGHSSCKAARDYNKSAKAKLDSAEALKAKHEQLVKELKFFKGQVADSEKIPLFL